MTNKILVALILMIGGAVVGFILTMAEVVVFLGEPPKIMNLGSMGGLALIAYFAKKDVGIPIVLGFVVLAAAGMAGTALAKLVLF